MYDEDDLLPLSSLQHLSFCERQWGLIRLEGIWEDNPLTVEGTILHERSDDGGTETRADVRIVRGLGLRSLRLGLSGRADVVEFRRTPSGPGPPAASSPSAGVCLRGVSGRWIPFPVEYKRGRPKTGNCDEVQLCAQACCLEEMLGASVPEGALFYGRTRRRHEVAFDGALRGRTEALAARLHELSARAVTPPPRYGTWCENCSLQSHCQPTIVGDSARVSRYLATLFADTERTDR